MKNCLLGKIKKTKCNFPVILKNKKVANKKSSSIIISSIKN